MPCSIAGMAIKRLFYTLGGGQVVRISPSTEPKRIHSSHILTHHTPMITISPDSGYTAIEIAAFPCLPTLGEAIEQGRLSEADAALKFKQLNNAILAEGYFLADGADQNLTIPRDNVGVTDDDSLIVIDGGMYSAKPVNLSFFFDGSRDIDDIIKTEAKATVQEPEKGGPLTSQAQLNHMRNRGLTMGQFKRTHPTPSHTTLDF